jgi:hypothetical protein
MSLPKSLRLVIACFATGCLALAVVALAQDERPDAKPASEKAKADQPAVPSAADFEAFMKLNQPGEHHAHLKQLAGTFDVEMETVMAPGAPAQKSKGVTKSEMILGGRYLQGAYKGDMMGMAFEGNSLMGYDVQKKKYFNAWIDSMTTGLVTFEGSCDKNGKVFTFTGEMDDAMTGRKMKIRHVTTIVSADKYTFEWFESADGGKEHRGMYATYTRKE